MRKKTTKKDCPEQDFSNLEDLDFEELQELEDQFYERQAKGLPINLENFRLLEEELENRCNQ